MMILPDYKKEKVYPWRNEIDTINIICFISIIYELLLTSPSI